MDLADAGDSLREELCRGSPRAAADRRQRCELQRHARHVRAGTGLEPHQRVRVGSSVRSTVI